MKDGWINCSEGEERHVIQKEWDKVISEYIGDKFEFKCRCEDFDGEHYHIWCSVSEESFHLRCCVAASFKGRYFSFKGRRES